MYLTTVKELGTALLTKGTAFALTQTATQTNNSSVNDVLDSAQEVTASTADEVNRFVQYWRGIFFCSSDHRFRRCGNWSGITRESVELCRRYLDSSSQTICGWRLYYCEFRGNRRNCKGNSDLLYKDDNNR